MILLISLLIWRLMELVMRTELQAREATVPGWDDKSTARPSAYMMTWKFKGILVLCIDGQRLTDRPNAGQVALRSPSPFDRKRMTTEPARRAGLVLDDGLADRIAEDAGDEPGVLLMAYALERTRCAAPRSDRLFRTGLDLNFLLQGFVDWTSVGDLDRTLTLCVDQVSLECDNPRYAVDFAVSIGTVRAIFCVNSIMAQLYLNIVEGQFFVVCVHAQRHGRAGAEGHEQQIVG